MDNTLGNAHIIENICKTMACGFMSRFQVEGCDTVFCVATEPDSDTHAMDYDCYDDAQQAAFERGEWRYVGVVVYPECDCCGNIDMSKCESLWGVEYDLPGREHQCREYIAELAIELAEECARNHELKTSEGECHAT
jgi:hypothetical protein